MTPKCAETTRRMFLQRAAAYGVGATVLGSTAVFGSMNRLAAQAAPTNHWVKQIGIGLYTVRDMMSDEASYRNTLAKLAEIGYKEVEPADRNDFAGRGYAGLSPKAFRALLDSHGLSVPSTHTSAIESPDLEKQLEGFQIMGIKYTEILAPTDSHATATVNSKPAASTGEATSSSPAKTMDKVMRIVDRTNKLAQVARKFGIKTLVRMDLDVFVPLSDKPDLMAFQVIADHTDPSLVAMQLDLGWAVVAGQDIVGMFKRNPHRYELWHVKDLVGIHAITPHMNFAERRRAVYFVPVGMGQIDFKTTFAAANLAGLKHFGIEQDNAPAWGDSLAAAGVNYQNMTKLLS